MIIKTTSYPRAALIGNPSDGYFGKTIAFTFRNFQADITLYPSELLEILPSRRDLTTFNSLESLSSDIRLFGYYGGIRIIKAALKKFHEYAVNKGKSLGNKGNFTIRYHTSIPPQLGLAGSSAIITAVMKALMEFYQMEIRPENLATLVLSVETEELGIGAGLQDRVAQAYQHLVYMDFDKNHMAENGFGRYEVLDSDRLPLLYIAYRQDLSEGSEVTHNNLRYRWNQGDRDVHDAMKDFALLTESFLKAMNQGSFLEMHSLINRNFDLRKSICAINPHNEDMVMTARSFGASAKFTGSGGAIIGTYADDTMFRRLSAGLAEKNIKTIKPEICRG